ncbi:hypothetical protein [uncultured Akkermansia sp.]|uniref:PBECR3 domain-containing polyvalent protein n=1 Tax=uncultured Akkermansia sp. TaxID=512294 RepID=UPI002631B0BD|nr:hypothetical protein [uncultured Akkermansia sp.]
MKWQTRGDLRPQAGRNAQLNVPDESGHVDLRPPIVNRPQVGPEAQLNFLSDEQANEMQRQLEERDGGVHHVPGSGIMNDRQYWRVLNDWRMAGVDSPHYYVERAALRRYEKNRGIDEGSVAAAGDVRKARAWQLLAEIGDGADLDAGQEQEVDQVLGAGTVKFYRGLSQEEKDEVLVDGYDRAFVGASTSLGRAYLAQKLGLDTDEASVMAAELRRQAGVGRARREQVKKDMEDVWGEIVAATGSGKEFSLDPHDHQGRSPEFLAGAARMAESQKKAAALIREFAYGEDGKSPHAQGVRTGVTGVRVMGFSKEGDGSWLVSKLVELNREDPVAYQMALEAVQGLVMKDSDEHGLMNRYFESLPWGGLAKKGMQLMLKPELHKNIFNAASNVAGMAGEAVLGTMRAASHKKMMADAERRKRLKAGGAMTPGDYMLWRKAQENPNVLNGPEVNDPQWVQRVNQVAQDLQRVRMGQFQSRGKTVLGRFIEDAGSVVGGAVPFMASFGVLPVLQTMEQEETGYLAKGAEPAKAALAAMGEGVGMWAANIWGLGKGGKLVGKAYDKLMNWAGKKAGYRGLLARALETDRWWGRGPLFVGMEGVVLHSQTVMEPYARYLASNMFTGGDGKSFNEALAEAKEAMTWRNFLVGLPMSVLLGYGRYAQNSPFRASQAAIAEFNRMKLEWADSREAMEGGGFAEADIKAILNAKNDGERLKLFDLGLERSEMMKMVREGKANVENDIALMIVPDSNEANMLMEMGAIPRFEIVDGKVRVYGAESMDFKGQKEEVSARDSVGAEPGKEIKEESGGENEGQERRRRTDYVEFNMDEAGYYLTAKAREWYSNQDFTLKNAVLGNEAVDYFAKRCDVQFEKSGELMTRRYLERMADEALNRVNERRHSKDMWSREEADAQEEDVVLSVLPGSFRNRVEVAMKRNELSRNPQETGKITQREIDARSGDYGVHTPAFNYELECGKKVIRYYEGEATFLDLVEEMAELYVKGEIKAGRELGWFAGNLKETQEAFKAQGVRHWMLADVDLLDGKSGVKKQELAVVEGMSKLMQAVHVGEFRKRKLPESVQRFLEIAMALLRKVADMAGLAGAFRKAVDSGAVKGDFAAFVYDAVGADFIQTRYDAGKREFQKRLNEIKGKPERMLGFYDLHVAYAEQYGLENYLYQLEHPDTDKLQSDSKFLNFVGEKMKREFEAQGREFFEKMKGASLQEMKDVLKAARAWNRRYKNIYKLPEEAGKTVSFSITDKLDEMGKDAGKRKVMDFVDMVVSSDVPDKTSLGVVEYRGASVREIADIKAGLGIDVTGMVHEFPAKSIAHALKSHGHDSEAKRSQLNLTKEDIKLALDVLDHYDRVEFKPKGKNLSSVIYVKEYPHGEIHTVEQVIETTGRRSKKPRLTFKTAWVKRTAPAGTEPGVEGVYTPRRRKGSMANEGGNVNSVAEAQEQGLFRDGHFEAGNAVITEPGVTFSVIGPKAKTWDKYKDRAFKGRDDGMMRAELDASKAQLRLMTEDGRKVPSISEYLASRPGVYEAVLDIGDKDLANKKAYSILVDYAKKYNLKLPEVDSLAWRRMRYDTVDLCGKLYQLNSLVKKFFHLRPFELEKENVYRLGDVLDYLELYEAYPELKEIRVELKELESEVYGFWSKYDNLIVVSEIVQKLGTSESVRELLLHEIQHAIQGIEGFSPGINPNYAQEIVNKRASDWRIWNSKVRQAKKLKKAGLSKDDLYFRAGGEIEARNVEQRRLMSAEEREAKPFNDTLEFPGEAIISFSVREDLLGDMKRQMEKTRSDAVREYWRHVTERLEREELAMRALMLKPKGSDEFLRARIAEARSIMKVAVETLPESVRGKLAGQEQKLERWMKLLEGGAFHPGYTLARHDVERLAVDMGIMPEEMPFFIGKRVDELVLKTYRRAAEVIELYVRDGLFAETRKMISEHEAVIDEKTRKFKVSRLGAAPTEFLRSVIKPAVYATHAAAEKKAAELSERLRMLEMQLNEFKDGKVVSGMDALMKERMRLEGEFNWWMNYSAARSSDVNRMLGIHEAVSAFISRNAEVWQAHLHEKLEGWKKVGKALMDELPKDVNQKNMHLAEAEMTDLGTDSETGRIKRGVLSSWLDNTVNKLQQLGDGPGGEFFRKFKVEFLNVTNRTQALRAQQVEKMHDVMKKLSGATSERMLNQWLAEWDTKVDLGLTLREKGVKKTKLTIDQAAKLLERREKNPWWGVDMYSQKAIDLLREEYEAWGRGENRARKWFEVEEWYDMDPQPMPKLSRDQALFVLMCMDQPNVFDSRIPDRMTPMRRRGWTDEHKMKLEEFIGPEGMALKSILFEEYAQVGDMIRPLYEDRYGVPFSKRRNYSPLRWMVDETRDDSELASILGDDGTIAVGRSDGFLSVRDESHQRYLNTTQGALALFWKHHANAVNWVCTQEMVERYQGILSDPSVAQKLKVNIGALDYRGFQTLINRLEHGGRDAVAELDAAEVVKNRIMNARAVSVLAGQVTSLLRQTTAVFNALHGCDLSTAEWIHGMSRVISGKSVLSVRELFSSDLFQARKDGFMYSVLLGYKKQLGGRLGLLEQLSEKSMNALGWLDAGCNAVSFAAAFDHYFRQGVEQGMSKPEAMEYARDVIEEGLSTAQPTNWTQMPKMLEKTKGIFSEEWFLMSETLQRGATVFSLWKRGKKKLAMRSWLVQGVAMQVLGYLINNVMRPGGDDDEKKNPLNYLPGIVLGPLNGVPFLGRGADWLIEQAADIFDLKVQTRTGIAGSELEFMIKDLTGLFQDLEQVDNWQSVRMKSRGVATLGSITAMLGAWRNPRGGAITSVSLGMATLANYLKHLAGMAEKWFGE